MKQTHKIAKSALVAGVAITLSVSCGAQDAGSNRSQPPHFSGQAPGEAQAILRKIKGSVSAVDPKAMTLTVKLAEGDRVFKVTAKTKLSSGDKPALLKGVGVGKTVEAVIKMVHGHADEVVSVNIMAD
jgi:hypothetical protein